MYSVAFVAVLSLTAPQVRQVNADALPVLPVRVETRVGHADDPKLSFNRIRFVDVDREGNVYVFDEQSVDVRVFAKNGAYLRLIGRRGAGPGEFSRGTAITAFGVIGDTVWAYENLNRRVTRFARDGRVIGTQTMQSPDEWVALHEGAVGMLSPRFMRADGALVSRFEPIAKNGDLENRVRAQRGLTAIPAATDTVRVPRIAWRVGATKPDTIGWELRPPSDAPDNPVTTSVGAGGRMAYGNVKVIGGVNFTVPEATPPRYLSLSMLEGSAIITRVSATSDAPSTFTATRFEGSGKLAHRIVFTYQPRRYEGPILDSLAARSATKNGELNRDAYRALRAAMRYPPFQPPVFEVFVAKDGALWIRREWDASSKHRWIVVDKAGTVRGVVALPSGARLRWAAGNDLITEEPDENGVPWLVRYQIQVR